MNWWVNGVNVWFWELWNIWNDLLACFSKEASLQFWLWTTTCLVVFLALQCCWATLRLRIWSYLSCLSCRNCSFPDEVCRRRWGDDMDWDCTLSILALLVFDTIFGDHLVTPRIRTSLMEQPFILRPDWKRPISGRSICLLSIGNSAQAFSREWRDKIAEIHRYIVTSRCCVSLQSLVCICVYPSHSITWGIHETVLQSIIKHFQAFSSTKDRERERQGHWRSSCQLPII